MGTAASRAEESSPWGQLTGPGAGGVGVDLGNKYSGPLLSQHQSPDSKCSDDATLSWPYSPYIDFDISPHFADVLDNKTKNQKPKNKNQKQKTKTTNLFNSYGFWTVS